MRKPSFSIITVRPRVTSLFSSSVIRGAASLYASTIVTSLLGFLFWLAAAKILSPTDVGTASAVQSASQLVATVCLLGLGTLTIAEVAASKERAKQLIASTSIVAAATAALGALLMVYALRGLPGKLRLGLSTWPQLLIFVLLTAATAASLLVDDAAIGLLRGNIQLTRNAVFAAAKLAILPACVYGLTLGHGESIVLSWLFGALLSLLVAYCLLRSVGSEDDSWKPDFLDLVAKRRLIWSHHLLNVSILIPRLLAPVLVAAFVSPAANAGFTTALLITGFVSIIPSHLSTALFSLPPGDEHALAREARSSMRICLAISVFSAAFFIAFPRQLLSIFRGSYTSAAPALIILGLTTFPNAVKAHYVAISRVTGKMTRASLLASLGALGELLGVVLGVLAGDVTGVALGLLGAYTLEAALFSRTVRDGLRGPSVSDGAQP